MEGRVATPLLWLRAAFVGSTFFVFGVVGHVSAQGLLPAPAVLAFLLLLSVTLAGPFLARPASRLRLVSMLVGGQIFVHAALSASGGHRGDAPAASGSSAMVTPPSVASLPTVDGRRVGSLFDATQVATGQQTVSVPRLPLAHLVSDLGDHAPMMLAHLAAAVLLGLWLAVGEKTLWTLISLTARRLVLVARLLQPAPGLTCHRAVRPDGRRLPARHDLWHSQPPALRGPPVAAAC